MAARDCEGWPCGIADTTGTLEPGKDADFLAVARHSHLCAFGDVTLLPGLIDVHQHLVFDASACEASSIRTRHDDTV